MRRIGAWIACISLMAAGLAVVDRVIAGRLTGLEALQPWILGMLAVLALDAYFAASRRRK